MRASEASLQTLITSKDGKIAELEEEIVKQVEQFHARETEIKAAAAVAHFQKEYLLSPFRQSFLKTLQEGLLDAFLNSRIFLTKLVPVAKAFYKYCFSWTQKQAEDQGFQGEFDHKTPLKSAPPIEGWHEDNDEPIEHPW